MAEYKLTNKAVEDLAEIWDYTFDKWSEKQANNYWGLLKTPVTTYCLIAVKALLITWN